MPKHLRPRKPEGSLGRTAQGPYAWVQGRRATSKVTATSGGRLTNRYAWVPGRPTRRACLGVNLPLRVPPCKHYPEEVTELKMAALILLRYRRRRLLRRNRIFRDRTNPLHKFNDLELFWQFRFRRADILQMTNELKEELEHLNRKGALPPVFTGRATSTLTQLLNYVGGVGGGGGLGGGRDYRIIYLLQHCHHQNDSCFKIGSDENHFNVSLFVRDKVTKLCPQTTTFEEEGESKPAESS